ncbi:glycosyltransferase [Adlercreutzia sp. ZJ154]|uniref:glycosyltransferase n=1 Tax=Adlercreutzia sp. ZJ154 TaxID=2709790 RepID=UPI0013ED9EE5|nr:glycosyltransferase [Adlercreutzia sp. ZJ154]
MIGGLNAGGSQSFVMSIYRSIDRDKVQFDFVLDHPDETLFVEEVESLGGKVYCLPSLADSGLKTVQKEWDGFLAAHSEYAILHSHIRSYASVYIPIAKKYGLVVIIHSHSTSNGSGITALVKAILQFPLRYQADYLMACSIEAGQWLFGKRRCKANSYMQINNAIDSRLFTFSEKNRASIREEFGVRDDEFLVGFIGRVSEPKNPKFIIEVFNELLKINSNSRLLFVGDGCLLSETKEYVAQLQISDNVVFTGTRGDSYKLLSGMDLFLFPSIWEGFGMSLIEAQSTDLMSVCSDRVPKSAIVISDLVKVISLEKEPAYWARYIATVRNDRSRRSRFAEISLSGFNIDENAKTMEDFYVRCAGEAENRLGVCGRE